MSPVNHCGLCGRKATCEEEEDGNKENRWVRCCAVLSWWLMGRGWLSGLSVRSAALLTQPVRLIGVAIRDLSPAELTFSADSCGVRAAPVCHRPALTSVRHVQWQPHR